MRDSERRGMVKMKTMPNIEYERDGVITLAAFNIYQGSIVAVL